MTAIGVILEIFSCTSNSSRCSWT